jgi:hypothetical protein
LKAESVWTGTPPRNGEPEVGKYTVYGRTICAAMWGASALARDTWELQQRDLCGIQHAVDIIKDLTADV